MTTNAMKEDALFVVRVESLICAAKKSVNEKMLELTAAVILSQSYLLGCVKVFSSEIFRTFIVDMGDSHPTQGWIYISTSHVIHRKS